MLNKVAKILKKYVDDNCLGRNFAQLLSGYSNTERGRILKTALAFAVDSGQKFEIEPSNFYGFKFRNNKDFEKLIKKPGKCWVCDGLFENLDKFVEKAKGGLKELDFNTFLVGCRPSKKLIDKEEELWMTTGIEHCEPLKAEVNREIGKRLERELKKRVDLKNPDVTVLIDLENDKVSVKMNPLFIFGYYKKLIRGIPQCRWGTPNKYKTSVEQIIAKPIMKLSKGKDHKFHGLGREDIDALCLDWRAFVLEIENPKKRNINLKKTIKQINKTKKVLIKDLKFSNMNMVRKIKALKVDKTYRVLVKTSKSIKKYDLKVLKKLKGIVEQQTPERVLHRRADLFRKREVKEIKWKFINKKTFELKIKGTAGLYIKELVSGDSGRTKPSVSELLNAKAVCKELDVIKIEKIKL